MNRHAAMSFLTIALTLLAPLPPLGCAPTVAEDGAAFNPEGFRGLIVLSGASNDLVAAVDISPTIKLSIYGRMTADLLPTDVYKLVIADAASPQNSLAITLDDAGRLDAVAVGGALHAAYAYSPDGATVFEYLGDGSVRSFAAMTGMSPRDVLSDLGAANGVDLSVFFDTFDPTRSPAKLADQRLDPTGWTATVLNTVVSVTGLVLSVVGLMAITPEASLLFVAATLTGHIGALMSTGISLARLSDTTGNVNADPRTSALENGLLVVGLGTDGVTSVIDWFGNATSVQTAVTWVANGADVSLAALSDDQNPPGRGIDLSDAESLFDSSDNPPPSEQDPTGYFLIEGWGNTDGTSGVGYSSAAQISLDGPPERPTISWQGIDTVYLYVTTTLGAQRYAIVALEDETGEFVPLESPVDYGDYERIDATIHPLYAPTAPDLTESDKVQINLIDTNGDNASLVFRLR
jgi:hypothetical protein